jgi:DNA (cytosine-5)-methyltransferase 1
VGDAIDYIEGHREGFDFVWASPPCQTHTTMSHLNKNKRVPDLRQLQGLIIFIESWSKYKYCVENVVPWYTWLIRPTVLINRHPYWTNFPVEKKEFKRIYLSHKTTDENGHIHIHDLSWRELAYILALKQFF